MGLDKVIKLALSLTMVAALTGQLPRVTTQIRVAQVKLLQKSRASHWGSRDLLYTHKVSKSGQ